MKPKPFSIRQRILLVEALAMSLAFWVLAVSVWASWRVRGDVERSVAATSQGIRLELQIRSEVEKLQQIANLTQASDPRGETPEFRDTLSRLATLIAEYRSLLRTPQEQEELTRIEQGNQELAEAVRSLFGMPQDDRAQARRHEIQGLAAKSGLLLQNLSLGRVSRLDAETKRLHTYTLLLSGLLVASGLLTMALLVVSRRMLREILWKPVGELGAIVRQIRKGNLRVQAEIPHSVELGPLVDSFVHMADELRAAREKLEEKVATQSRELNSAQRKLVETAKLAALGQLVSGVAHEVNNPLTSILGFAEVLLGNPALDAASRRQLQIIRDESLRLRNVVANLSSFGRRAPQQRMRVNLARVLDRAAELRRYQLAANGIQLHWTAPAGPVWVDADADQILQVLFNLLLNAEQAIQAGNSKGEIRLECGTADGTAYFRVADNGVGMSREVQERIFEPYFTTKPVGQGSGLGLSISHGIVAQHNGKITVESAPGEGAALTVSLPAAVAPAETTVPPKEAPVVPHATSRGSILVIDDETDITDLLSGALSRRGWNVVTLNDPTLLEDTLRVTPFDVVLSDLKMPGRNGMEVRAALESARPELARRFLLMTGNLADADTASMDLSTVTVLRKPFTLAQLDEALRMLERQVESRREGRSNARASVETNRRAPRT